MCDLDIPCFPSRSSLHFPEPTSALGFLPMEPTDSHAFERLLGWATGRCGKRSGAGECCYSFWNSLWVLIPHPLPSLDLGMVMTIEFSTGSV